MTDDKIIAGLEAIVADDKMWRKHDYYAQTCKDALELIKARKKKYRPGIGGASAVGGVSSWWYKCGACGFPTDRGDRFCRYCGEAEDWSE